VWLVSERGQAGGEEGLLSLHCRFMHEEVPSNKSLHLTLLAIHFKNARIIGKLLRAQQALDRDKDDLLSALGPALDLIEAELENK
jgi:hypothetical protein